MKRVGIVLLLCVCCSVPRLYAQTDTISKSRFVALNEAALSLSYAGGGMAFGVIYKLQVGRRRFFRASLADIRFNGTDNAPVYSNQFPSRYLNFNANLSLGVEWRFKLHKLVTTYTGIDIVAGVSYYVQRIADPSLPANFKFDDRFDFSAGLAFNSGVRFRVHELIRVGINVSPDIIYKYSPWEYSDSQGNLFKGVRHTVGTSFNSGSVQLQMIFVWNRNHKVGTEKTP